VTFHRCVSVCWYPDPVTEIVHEADPDQRDAEAPLADPATAKSEAARPAETSACRTPTDPSSHRCSRSARLGTVSVQTIAKAPGRRGREERVID